MGWFLGVLAGRPCLPIPLITLDPAAQVPFKQFLGDVSNTFQTQNPFRTTSIIPIVLNWYCCELHAE
jgi:hypothetical protein